MTAVPVERGVTIPVAASTLATAVASLDHTSVGFEALLGATVKIGVYGLFNVFSGTLLLAKVISDT